MYDAHLDVVADTNLLADLSRENQHTGTPFQHIDEFAFRSISIEDLRKQFRRLRDATMKREHPELITLSRLEKDFPSPLALIRLVKSLLGAAEAFEEAMQIYAEKSRSTRFVVDRCPICGGDLCIGCMEAVRVRV